MDSGQALAALDAGTVVTALAVFTVATVVAGSAIYAVATIVAGSAVRTVGAWQRSDVGRLSIVSRGVARTCVARDAILAAAAIDTALIAILVGHGGRSALAFGYFKQWTRLEGRSAVDQILGPRDAVHRTFQAIVRRRGFCTCAVISLDFGSCETVWRSGTCGHWRDVADRICISPHADLFFDHPTFRSRSSRLRDDSRWPCQQHMREWRMSSLIG